MNTQGHFDEMWGTGQQLREPLEGLSIRRRQEARKRPLRADILRTSRLA